MAPSSKPKLQKFAGVKSKIKISSWLSLFDVLATGLEVTDDPKKIALLMEYLEDEALQFFADDIADHLNTLTWLVVKERMNKRFGERTIDPVLAASRRRWNKGHETVQEYYEDKMYLLRKTGLAEASMAEVLTDGMPFGFRNNLIAATIINTSDWLSKAVRLESSFNSNPKVDHQRPIAAVAASQPSFKSKPKSKRPPPGPCKYCKSLGKSNEQANHWQSDCRNKPQGTQTNAVESHDVDHHEANSMVSLN